MRWLTGVVLALVFVVALAIAATPILISADTLEHAVVDALEELTGRRVTVSGEATIFPNLRLTVEGIRVAGAAGGPPLMAVESISADFGLLPLALGRFELSDVHFRKPRLLLRRDAAGRPNWRGTGIIEDLLGRPDAATGASPVGRVTVEAGTVTYTDAEGVRLRLSDVVGLIDWPDLDRRARVSGSVRWQRQVVDFDGEVVEPLDLLGGGVSDVRLEVTSAPLRAEFDGSAAIQDTIQLDGQLRATVTSLADLFEALALPPGPTLGPVAVSGEVNWDNDQVAMADAAVEIDGDDAQGALTLELGERPRLLGTLAFDTLDLAPQEPPASESSLASVEAGLAGLAPLIGGRFRTDLRLSATTVRYGSLEAGPAAATLTTGDDGVTVSIGQAEFADGLFEGEIRVSPASEGGVNVAGHATASALDLAKVLARTGLPPVTSGLANVRISGHARATTFADLAAATATIHATVANGELRDLGLWHLPEGDSIAPFAGEATPFDSLTLGADLTPTHVTLTQAEATYRASTAVGAVVMTRRNGALSGTLTVTPGEPAAARSYDIGGRVTAPVLSRTRATP